MNKSSTKIIQPSRINGTLQAPASKSMLQRAIAAALLSGKETRIHTASLCDDAEAAMRIITALGASVQLSRPRPDEPDQPITIRVSGSFNPVQNHLDCGEAGLSIRMFTPIAALASRELRLLARGSLLTRPVTMMEDPLRQLNVEVTSTDGCPPLTVKGPITGGEVTVDGSVSSQFLTGLLMALPVAANHSTLTVTNLKSVPYIDMTLKILDAFRVTVTHRDYKTFEIKGNQQYDPPGGVYTVEGDWSGAAFLLVAGAIAGQVTVTNLDTHSTQADIKILEALRSAGADVTTTPTTVTVKKKPLNGFVFDASHCPDLFPPLAALACNCEGTTQITGVQRLFHKESNRAAAIRKEFTTLGGSVAIDNDIMNIKGTPLKGATIDSHNDHRIAMAAAVAALTASSPVTITNPSCIDKSYPGFYNDLSRLQN